MRINIIIFLLITLSYVIYAQPYPSVQILNTTTGLFTPMIYSNNGSYNQLFIIKSSTFNCSINKLYICQQNQTQITNNTPYYINIYNMTPPITFNFTTVYSNILNFTNISQNCSSQANSTNPINCSIQISNGCSLSTNIFNDFDRVVFNLQQYQPMTYNIVCSSQYYYNSFQFGNLIEILYCTILLMILPIYSRAWSIKGQGITMNIWIIIGLIIGVVILGIIGYFSMIALNYIATILSWLGSIVGIGFCMNQTLFLTKNQYLLKGFSLFNKIPCRFIQLISLIFGIGVTCAWFFLDKNWIINDLIFTCFTIFVVKVFKFTSLKLSVIIFSIVIVAQFAAILVIFFVGKGSYNDVLLNSLNYPFQIQFPTINAVINQKCAWLPVTSVIFPGMLFSYFRRFDTSRNTRLYMIISIAMFIVGSITWIVLSIAVPFSLPFGFITQPAAMGLVSIFAYKRKQLRTLWYGRFYDQQFADMDGTKNIQQVIQFQRRGSDLSSIKGDMLKGLQINGRQDSSFGAIYKNGRNKDGSSMQPSLFEESI